MNLNDFIICNKQQIRSKTYSKMMEFEIQQMQFRNSNIQKREFETNISIKRNASSKPW